MPPRSFVVMTAGLAAARLDPPYVLNLSARKPDEYAAWLRTRGSGGTSDQGKGKRAA